MKRPGLLMLCLTVLCMAVLLVLNAGYAHAADWGLKKGTPNIRQAGPLAFGPDGVLFVGDPEVAAVFALDTGDGKAKATSVNVDGIEKKIANQLESKSVQISDMVVNPESGKVYFSVTSKHDGKQTPAIVSVDAAGNVGQLNLESIAFSKVELPDAPDDKPVTIRGRKRNLRNQAITDLAYVDSIVLVSGLSKGSAPSTVREIAFPFRKADPGANIEIFHGAHGRVEDYAAPSTIVPFNINGEPNVLAGFTCTPLVKFPISELTSGKKTRGTTVAELGNRNRPLDMIVYQKDGKDFLLMANSTRGVMKISTENIERKEGIQERVGGGGTAGQTYDTIAELKNVVQLDKLNDQNAVILIKQENGAYDLQTIPLP